MTAPAIGSGLSIWPQARSSQPVGSDRYYWASLQSSETTALWRLPSGNVVAPFENPAGSAGNANFVAGVGNSYLRANAAGQACSHFAVGGAANVSPTISPTFPMDLPSGVGYMAPNQVLVFREVIQWTQNADAAQPASIATIHGFTCQFNTQYNVIPVGVLTSAAVSAIGLAWLVRTGQWAIIRKRNPGAAIIDVLTPAEYNGAAWNLVEHRLYAPAATEPGRYEFWLNRQLLRTISGADANFPIVQAASWKYGALLQLSDNYGGKSGGFRVRYSELITGPITDNVLAYE